MKYVYSLAIAVLLLLSINNFLIIRKANSKLEESHKKILSLDNDAQNYLSSLTNDYLKTSDFNIYFLNGDSVCSGYINETTLIYYFTFLEGCFPCIEKNIYTLIQLANEKSSIKVFLIGAKEHLQYLSSLSRTYSNKYINIGYTDSEIFSVPCYFIVNKYGEFSNVYYPVKGHFSSTERYLNFFFNNILNIGS